jgi:glutaredoxin 2
MKLYVYDHCPYCVRARMPFGFKSISFDLVAMLNDDIDTPTRMVGKKVAPILEKDDGSFMPESMDICRYVDGLDGNPIFAASANREDLAEWIKSQSILSRRLLMPRWPRAPLGEFATAGGVAYFTRAKEGMIGPFHESLAESDALKAELEAKLVELEGLIRAPEAVNGALSEDDIDLFGRIRAFPLIKDLQIPPGVWSYMDYMSAKSGVPLQFEMATI